MTEFAVYVLRDLVSHREKLPALSKVSPTEDAEVEPLNPDEIEAIRKRLSSLGYL